MRKATYQLEIAKVLLQKAEDGHVTPPVSSRALIYESEEEQLECIQEKLRPETKALLKPTELGVLQTAADTSLVLRAVDGRNHELDQSDKFTFEKEWKDSELSNKELSHRMKKVHKSTNAQLATYYRQQVNMRWEDRERADEKNQSEQRFKQKAADIAAKAEQLRRAREEENERIRQIQEDSKRRVAQEAIAISETSHRNALEAACHAELMRLQLKAPQV